MSSRARGAQWCIVVVGLLAGVAQAQAQGASNEALVKQGKTLWASRACAGCHGIGKALVGPDLAGMTKRRSRAWLGKFLKDTNQMLASDSTAKALLKQWKGAKMPQAKLTDPDIDALLAYVQSEEAKLKK